jgi:hypothetical protein
MEIHEWYMNCAKVICIDNVGYEMDLTLNRVYDIVSGDRSLISPIKIVNDKGKVSNYSEYRFISLDRWRNNKLDKIGIN